MTTEPNDVVAPIHEKAAPVILMTPKEVDCWLSGRSSRPREKPAPDDAIVVRPPAKKAA